MESIKSAFIYYYKSPIGTLGLVTDSEQVLTILFSKKTGKNDDRFPKVMKSLIKQLDEYFAGKRKEFDLPVLMESTQFQKKVLLQVAKIPYGKTKSYSDIAKAIKNPKAVRAVGGANKNNLIPIIIPCHRVIGADGKLTGYAGGLDKKKFLIEHELKNSKK